MATSPATARSELRAHGSGERLLQIPSRAKAFLQGVEVQALASCPFGHGEGFAVPGEKASSRWESAFGAAVSHDLQTMAGPASPVPRFGVSIRVRRAVWMSCGAVGSSGASGGNGLAAQNIDLRRYRFQVVGVYAVANAAEVVDLQTFGDFPVGFDVGEAVGENIRLCASSRVAEAAVSSRGFPSLPEPAMAEVGTTRGNRAGLIDFGPEPDCGWNGVRHSVAIIPAVGGWDNR